MRDGVNDGSHAYMFLGGRKKLLFSGIVGRSSTETKGRSDGVEDGKRSMDSNKLLWEMEKRVLKEDRLSHSMESERSLEIHKY